MQVAQFLEQQFPELRGHITGSVYPAPPLAEFAANIITLFQLVGIAWMLVGGDKLIRMTGYQGPLPAFYWTIQVMKESCHLESKFRSHLWISCAIIILQENPVPLAIFLFLLAPQLINGLRTNGAFEIYLDDEILFSKLERGTMPTADDLVKPLVSAGLQHQSTS